MKTIGELEQWDCRWPTTVDEKHLYCCANPRVIARSYCAAHMKLAYKPTPPQYQDGAALQVIADILAGRNPRRQHNKKTDSLQELVEIIK